jgi:hypothetical protein
MEGGNENANRGDRHADGFGFGCDKRPGARAADLQAVLRPIPKMHEELSGTNLQDRTRYMHKVLQEVAV